MSSLFKKKRVLCIFKNDLRFLSKTKTRRILDMASEFEVFLLLPEDAYVEEKIKKKVKAIFRVPLRKKENIFYKLINFFKIIFYACKCARKEKVEIVYTPPTIVIIAGFLCKKIFQMKWVIDLYDPPISAIKRRSLEKVAYNLGSTLIKHLINTADMVAVTVIPESVSWLKVKNVIYLTNGVDLKGYMNSYKHVTSPNKNSIHIVSIETSILNSGIEYLFKACKILLENDLDIKVKLIGYIDGKERIKTLVKEYGLEGCIQYMGGISSEFLPKILSDCDIGVIHLPSGPHRDETFPLKVFEYLAARLAIVSFQLDGISKILRNGENAILVRHDDPVALAEGILEVVNNDSLRSHIRQNALKDAKKYDWNLINSKFMTKLGEI